MLKTTKSIANNPLNALSIGLLEQRYRSFAVVTSRWMTSQKRRLSVDVDRVDVALLLYLEDEQSSEEEENRSEESELFKNRSSEGAFQILVCRHLHCNDESSDNTFA
ncbi:hypothetical protein TNCV_633621 [Trichonephila clavipes]|nr:hypothetical protein TNCV_633621 [Trichonephila clavipes]